MATTLMIVVLLVLMPLRVPVCAAMGLSAIVGLMMLDMPLNTLVRYMATDVRSVPLLAIPFFVLAGNLMNQFGMTRRIFDFLEVVVGYFSGGLAQVAVLAALVFGGISGSALATIAGLGVITVHAMQTAGYRPEFAAALVVAASLMDPLIPPSIMFIIYAVQMNVSIADLFVAGIVPGMLLGVLLMANNAILAKLGIEKSPPPDHTLVRAAQDDVPARTAGAADADRHPAQHDHRARDADRGERAGSALHVVSRRRSTGRSRGSGWSRPSRSRHARPR